ncbi:SDR family NAD(P)-dependent oxidoreductase [Nocardia sp. NBC_01503]|uniref:SDR family NAD(P)-dependent oxidoreductase n=1 Tax=Nocardia sp. NBC_01503 TaxID=2975997 RepID=UPI002E7B600A|nr:SDR family NAD(P)-dependent oxidoreductase [Nocardia sp. NBC_01503]WTL33571.1 SDR family NAD(P)-dependent oxidoreductase [Nocardia sp. NBC_01503]
MIPTTRTGRALVTGASAGIGRAFATTLAARGYTVTAVARGAAGLAELRDEIGSEHEFLVADLATDAGIRIVTERLGAANYAVLVNNAGTATHGDFANTPLPHAFGALDLNCRSVIALAHAFLVSAEPGGALVNVASELAFDPEPGLAVYSATKAFVTTFSETLWHEQHSRGVQIIGLCPGVTVTRAQTAAGIPAAFVQTPQQVVDRAFAALTDGSGPIVHTNDHYRKANTMYTNDIDDTAIRALIERSAAAWGRGDGTAYGACFTDDATDVTYVGTVYHGGKEIGAAHQALFDSFLKGTRLTIDIQEIRRYGADTAIVVTRGESGKGEAKKLGKLATYTVIRDTDGEWRIAAVQKTQHKPIMEAVSFKFQPATRPAAH